MDDEKHALLRSLGTIGCVQVNDKLDISGSKIEIHRPGFVSRLKRTFWSTQTVDDSIARIKSVLNDCSGHIDSYMDGYKILDKKGANFLLLLLKHMKSCAKKV